jgi:predicted RNase H-like HicB family nuclease
LLHLDEDQAFIADVPELLGCMAHGDTYDDVLASAKEAIELWIETAKEFGDPIPKARGHRLEYA